jgi:hypothetical protein
MACQKRKNTDILQRQYNYTSSITEAEYVALPAVCGVRSMDPWIVTELMSQQDLEHALGFQEQGCQHYPDLQLNNPLLLARQHWHGQSAQQFVPGGSCAMSLVIHVYE